MDKAPTPSISRPHLSLAEIRVDLVKRIMGLSTRWTISMPARPRPVQCLAYSVASRWTRQARPRDRAVPTGPARYGPAEKVAEQD
jgi:hypothetical protein